jgi:hypothetical protein
MGTPVFIAATTQSNIAQSATPTNVPVPAGAQAGDLLIAIITAESSSNRNLTFPDGWSIIVQNTQDLFRDSSVIAAGIHTSGTTYPVACTGVLSRVRTLCYRDVNQTTPITASGIKIVNNANPNTTTALAVSDANSLELAVFVNIAQSGVAITADSGMTSRINSATYVSLDASDAAVSVGTTPVRTITQANTTLRSIANLVIAGTGGGGSPPSGTVTIGTITKTSTTATVPYTYDAADQTGFEYRLNGGSPVADAASPVDLTGLTANTAYTIEVRAVNASGQGAWSAVGNFTTDAAGSVPSGTVTIGTITTTQTTSSVPYTYSASDQTGFQYRLNGGAATTASASPISLTGLTAATAYTIEVRAINAAGNGSWSSSAPFTTAAVVVPSFTLTDLTNNANAPWASTANITVDVYNPSTGALVVRKTGLTSTAGADLVVSDAALVAATTYNVFITIGTAIGAVKATAA